MTPPGGVPTVTTDASTAVAFYYPRVVMPDTLPRIFEAIPDDVGMRTVVLEFKKRHYHHNAYLYGVVRRLARTLPPPINVVETGVLEGVSSAFVLLAIRDAGVPGHLWSIDNESLEPYTGGDTGLEARDVLREIPRCGMVPPALRPGWTYMVGDARDLLPDALEAARPVALFHHDSLHTYDHMMFEFETAWPHLVDGGALAADDALWTRAVDDFSHSRGLVPLYAQNTRVPGACAVIVKEKP